MKPIRSAVLAVLFLGLVAIGAPLNIFVDGRNGSDQQGEGTQDLPFATISYAIDFAANLDPMENPPPHDIYVRGGNESEGAYIYYENVVMQDEISLYGGCVVKETDEGDIWTTAPQTHVNLSVIHAVDNGAPAVTGASMATFDRFSVRAGSHGMLCPGSSAFIITNNDIDPETWSGPAREDATVSTYNAVRCLNCSSTGESRVQITTNTLTGNVDTQSKPEYQNDDGIYLLVSSPLIAGNEITGNGLNGIACVLSDFGSLSSPSSDQSSPNILANKISENGESGIYAEDRLAQGMMGVVMFVSSPQIIGNEISNNGRHGVWSTHLVQPDIGEPPQYWKDRTELIDSNKIWDNEECGITLCWSSSPRVVNNDIRGNAFAGISVSQYTDPIIDSNFLYRNGNYGISIKCHTTATVTNNQIQWTDGPGIQIEQFAAPQAVSFNAIGWSNSDGIYVKDFAQPILESNLVACSNGHGISIEGETAGTILHTVSISNFLNGIQIIDTASFDIRETIVTGNKMNGIFCTNDSSPVIQNVVVEDNHANGIFIDDDSHPTISDCIIAGNDIYGVYEHVISCDPAALTNNCFFGNTRGDYVDEGSDVLTSNTQINAANNGSSPVNANIVANPLFRAWGDFTISSPVYVDVSRAGDIQDGTFDNPFDLIIDAFLRYDFSLSENSPCIGAGTSGQNIGAYPSQSTFPPQGNLVARIAVSGGGYFDSNLMVNHNVYLEGSNAIILGDPDFVAMFPKSGSVVDGFWFTNGFSSYGSSIALYCLEGSTAIIEDCTIEFAQRAGILCYKSNPIIMRNIIDENYAEGVQCLQSAPAIVNNTSISSNLYNGILVEGLSAPTISGNTLDGNGFAGVLTRSNSTPRITNNSITNSQYGVYVENTGASTIIQGNTITNHSKSSIICYSNASPNIRSNTIQNNLTYGMQCYYNSSPNIFNNIISNNSWDGIYCYNQCAPKIVNNMIYRNRNSGIRLEQACNAQVTNNTIVSNSYSGVYLIKDSRPFIVNNILAHNMAYGIREEDAGSDPQAASNNCFYGNLRSYFDEGSAIYVSGADVNTAVDNGSYPHANNFDGDPLFTDFYANDFHINAGSPCIDAADPTWAPDFDFQGDSRPQGAGFDVGADEYQSTAAFALALNDSLWNFVTVTNRFAAPASAASGGTIQIISSSNTNTFGYWCAQSQPIPVFSNSLYRARFNVATDVTDALQVPTIRLRANTDDMTQSNFLQLNSTGDGSCVPTPSGRTYDLYIFPPQGGADGASHLLLSFDLLNFDPGDAASAALTLNQLVVSRVPMSTLGAATPVTSYSFIADAEGWTPSGEIPPFSSPIASWYPGQIQLLSQSNTNTFGYWSSPAADVTVNDPNTLYRASFTVSSNLSNPADAPTMRLRLNSLDSQIALVETCESTGTGANSPGLAPKTYEVFYAAPATAPSHAVSSSCDVLNFDPSDRADAQLNLESAVIESFSLPAFP